MQAQQSPVTPALAAHYDWMLIGQFNPDRFQGEQRRQYEEEQCRIERQWDNQPR